MKPRAPHTLCLCALLLILGMAVDAAGQAGQQQYKDEVVVKLNLVVAAAATELGHPLRATHEVYYVNLANDTYKDVSYALNSDTTYVFVGAGDNDCGSLQLKLYDGYGKLVDSDKPSEIPVVAMDVGTGGTAYVRVTMRGCRVQSCWAGVAVYTAK